MLASQLANPGTSGWATGRIFPSAATTGPAAGGYTITTTVTGNQTINPTGTHPSWITVNPDGSFTVTGVSFTGQVTCAAENISFLGCQFTAAGLTNVMLNHGNAGYLLQYCKFGPTPPAQVGGLSRCVYAPGVNDIVIDRCDMSGTEQPINLGSDNNVTITNNYLHHPRYLEGDHTELIYIAGNNDSITIQGNTILNPQPQTGAITLFQDNPGPYTNVLIDSNLMAGGGNTMYLGNNSSGTAVFSNFVVSNNWISTCYFANGGVFSYRAFQPVPWGGTNLWQNNRWYDGPSAGQLLAQ